MKHLGEASQARAASATTVNTLASSVGVQSLSAAETTFFSIAEVGAERGPAQPVAASDEAGGTAQELRTVCEPILSVYLCGVGA